jgi:quinoprotein glucose dehydrogenase
MKRRNFLFSLAAAPAAASAVPAARWSKGDDWQWEHYGGDAAATRYAPLDQINQSNVKNLKVAWVHKCGDHSTRPQTTIETTPIVVDGVMYLLTPRLKTQALDAATGKLLWTFDPAGGQRGRRPPGQCRGVCYWQNEDGSQKRIFAPVRDMLYSIDARTGQLDPTFGNGGVIDLKQNLDYDMEGVTFSLTSPPLVYKNLLLVGGGGGEGPRRAFP